jgi:hypothetical protein
MPDYSSLSLVWYLIYNDATVEVLALFSTLHHCQFWIIHNEMYTSGWNVLRVFWCTDISHWSKWGHTHLHPPLTANVLLDVAAIHIFSPWSSPCCMGHKNWCSSGTWVTNTKPHELILFFIKTYYKITITDIRPSNFYVIHIAKTYFHLTHFRILGKLWESVGKY